MKKSIHLKEFLKFHLKQEEDEKNRNGSNASGRRQTKSYLRVRDVPQSMIREWAFLAKFPDVMRQTEINCAEVLDHIGRMSSIRCFGNIEINFLPVANFFYYYFENLKGKFVDEYFVDRRTDITKVLDRIPTLLQEIVNETKTQTIQ